MRKISAKGLRRVEPVPLTFGEAMDRGCACSRLLNFMACAIKLRRGGHLANADLT